MTETLPAPYSLSLVIAMRLRAEGRSYTRSMSPRMIAEACGKAIYRSIEEIPVA